jgi:hypothetical protein
MEPLKAAQAFQVRRVGGAAVTVWDRVVNVARYTGPAWVINFHQDPLARSVARFDLSAPRL